LIDVVWRGAAVTDDSLVQCIHEIRKALKDDRHTLLQTATRRGYRLLTSLQRPPAPVSIGPSIAVLIFKPLTRTSEVPEFPDGLLTELVIGLSKIRGLTVIAHKDFCIEDPHDLASRLGVRYLVDGTVRGSGSRLRISAELIDGGSGARIWTARFDLGNEDVLDLQEKLARQIVGVLEPAIRRAEIERARLKPSGSLDAYDLCLQAIPYALSNTAETGEKALGLLVAALAIDPDYLPAHAYAAWCHEQRYLRNGFEPADRVNALAHADLALNVNSDDPQAISIAAFVRANLTRDYDSAVRALDRALAINGSSSLALGFSALVSAHSERHDRAVRHARLALELSPPDDPMNYHPYCALTVAHLFAGEFVAAAENAAATIRSNPEFSVAHAYLVASLVELGRIDAAKAAAIRLLEIAPTFSVSGFVRMNLFRASLTEAIAAALRRADVPESDGDGG
jgi:TolB-like protein